MRYVDEATAPRRPLKSWMRRAAGMALATGCAIIMLEATSAPAAAMTADDCQKMPMDALMLAVDQGLCTLDVEPSAGPAQIADKGTTGEHDGGDSGGGPSGGGPGGGGSGGGGSGGSGSGGSGGGSSGGEGDGGGDDGGDNGGGDDGGSGGGDDGSGGDDGPGHDHNHDHGHGHGHDHGGCGGD